MSSIPSDLERAVKSLWSYVEPLLTSPTEGVRGRPPPSSSPSWTDSWLPSSLRFSQQKTMALPSNLQILVRLAGVSGAAAVMLGAYGSHSLRKHATPEAREVFETGNRYHLIHSVALGLAPFAKRPQITAGLFLAGILMFSGGCYGYALWQSKTVRSVTPFGGILLILAWLSFLL